MLTNIKNCLISLQSLHYTPIKQRCRGWGRKKGKCIVLFLLFFRSHISKSFTCFWIWKQSGSIVEHWGEKLLLKNQNRILDIAWYSQWSWQFLLFHEARWNGYIFAGIRKVRSHWFFYYSGQKICWEKQLRSLLITNYINSLPHSAAGNIQPLSSSMQVAPSWSSVFNTGLRSFIHSSCPACTSSPGNLKKEGLQACHYYNPLSVYSRDGEKTSVSAGQETSEVVARTEW